MANRITSALQRIVLAAALTVIPKSRKAAALETPEPICEPILREPVMDDAWMFDSARTVLDHSTDMLASEMNRLSGAVSGLRDMLSTISEHAPVLEQVASVSPFAALNEDAMLFDGEPMAASDTGRAMGGLDFLFGDERAPSYGLPVFDASQDVSRAA